jgi:hypothetical protein
VLWLKRQSPVLLSGSKITYVIKITAAILLEILVKKEALSTCTTL